MRDWVLVSFKNGKFGVRRTVYDEDSSEGIFVFKGFNNKPNTEGRFMSLVERDCQGTLEQAERELEYTKPFMPDYGTVYVQPI